MRLSRKIKFYSGFNNNVDLTKCLNAVKLLTKESITNLWITEDQYNIKYKSISKIFSSILIIKIVNNFECYTLHALAKPFTKIKLQILCYYNNYQSCANTIYP